MQPPVWSPDGRRLAFAAAAGRTLVGLYTVPTDGAAPRTAQLPARASGDDERAGLVRRMAGA